MKLRKKLQFAWMIVDEGIRLWINSPRNYKLEIDHEWEDLHESASQAQEELRRELGRPTTEPMDHEAPPMKQIRLIHRYRDDEGQDRTTGCAIAINLERHRIDDTYTSSWLFGREHKGSGAIGVALFSLPVVLLLSPFLIIAGGYYGLMEKRRGYSRHGQALLEALSGQLDPATEALLIEALKNTWQYEQGMTRRVTLEEAKDILSHADLREEVVGVEIDAEYGDGLAGGTPIETRSFHWYDEQDEYVATGSFRGDAEHYVQVLGSRFEDADADALIGCYRSRTMLKA